MKMAVKREKGRVDLFGERFRARAHQLSPRLLAVASYINDNREAVLERTAMEIASATNTSDATVVRAIQALGFAGLRELRIAQAAWQVNETTENIGARRLHTVLERLIEDISYDASEMNGQTVTIDAEYVGKHLDVLVADEDLSRFIL